eukprot:1782068-Ditylum_brightwellii.AAC.1
MVNSTHPELAHAVHQCARFCADPKAIHENAVKHIVRYLLTTRPKAGREQPMYGLNMRLDMSRGFEVFVDVSFAGDWQQAWSEESSSVLSRTEIALSTTEAKYIAMSHAMREAIPLIRLPNEVKGCININIDEKAEFKYTVFEDNNGCIELANCPRMRPRTKHVSIKYHHFRRKVKDGSIRIERVGTHDQQADLLTKNLSRDQFLKLRRLICGW